MKTEQYAPTKRAALYIRVSTLEQAQEGYSVGEQKERLIAYCKAKDWLIADIYVDGGYTGSNLNRPGIQKLISETDKFDLVLVYKLDRLSRSQRDTLYLIEEVFRPKDVDFISMQESFDTSTPFGKAMIGLLAVFAQLEREQIKERTWMGRVARAKTGLHHCGGNIPIGYEYEDGKLLVNPYEAEQVKKIYEWYLAGASLKAITDRLQEQGYTNKYSSYNSWSSVRNILGNETYTGTLHFGDITVEDAHEAIISKEQFAAAQVLREKRQEKYGNSAFQSKHLLTGMLFCGHCGAAMVGTSGTSQTGTRHYYYTCLNKQHRKQCTAKNIRRDDLEKLILQKTVTLLNNKEAVSLIVNQAIKVMQQDQQNDVELENICAQIIDISNRLKNCMDAVDKGLATTSIVQRIEDYEKQLSVLKDAKIAAERKKDALHLTADHIKFFLHELIAGYGKKANQYRNDLFSAFIRQIIVYDDYIEIRYNYKKELPTLPNPVTINSSFLAAMVDHQGFEPWTP